MITGLPHSWCPQAIHYQRASQTQTVLIVYSERKKGSRWRECEQRIRRESIRWVLRVNSEKPEKKPYDLRSSMEQQFPIQRWQERWNRGKGNVKYTYRVHCHFIRVLYQISSVDSGLLKFFGRNVSISFNNFRARRVARILFLGNLAIFQKYLGVNWGIFCIFHERINSCYSLFPGPACWLMCGSRVGAEWESKRHIWFKLIILSGITKSRGYNIKEALHLKARVNETIN